MKSVPQKKSEEFTVKLGEPIAYKNGIPVLKAIPRDDPTWGWRIFCVYCQKFHNHKMMKSKIEHRIAHCKNRDSSYVLGGYYLQRVEDGTSS